MTALAWQWAKGVSSPIIGATNAGNCFVKNYGMVKQAVRLCVV